MGNLIQICCNIYNVNTKLINNSFNKDNRMSSLDNLYILAQPFLLFFSPTSCCILPDKANFLEIGGVYHPPSPYTLYPPRRLALSQGFEVGSQGLWEAS